MVKSIKTLMALSALAAVLAGCSTTSETGGTDDNQSGVDAEAADAAEAARAEAERRARKAEERARQAERAKCETADSVFYFDFDQSLLRAESRAALIAQAHCLQKYGSGIRIEGHADERGSREYNMALGERRANAVRDFLVLNGVSNSSIETVSYGEERPASSGSDEGSWAQNRRVELTK